MQEKEIQQLREEIELVSLFVGERFFVYGNSTSRILQRWTGGVKNDDFFMILSI